MIAPSLEDYIDRLNEIPSVTVALLHQIRTLDKKVLTLHIQILEKRDETLLKLQQLDNKPSAKLRNNIQDLLRDIALLHNSLLGLSKRKMDLSDQIYECIDTPTEELNRDLAHRFKMQENQQQTKTSKYKRPNKHTEQQFCASEPIYCYCRRPSFGLMVKCESDLCEVQWFHRQCLQQKTLADKWFCRECRKFKIKPKMSRI